MKNKKLIVFITFIMILSLTMILFAGCDKSDSLNLSTLLKKDNLNQSYKVETKTLSELDNYTILQAANNFVFAYTTQPESSEYSFILFNLKHGNTLGTFTSSNINDVQFENNQPFLATVSVRDSAGFTTVSHYSEYSILCSGDEKEYGISSSSTSNNVPAVVLNNGNYIYMTSNDSVAVIASSISNPPVYQMQEYDNFYLYQKSGVNYIYDKNSFKLSCNYNLETIIDSESAEYSEISRFTSGRTMIVNLRKELEEDDASYDIYEIQSKRKYDYKTLYVDLENGNLSVNDNPDILIQDTIECESEEYFNCTFFSYKEIKNKSFSTTTKLGAFDKNGKLTMCLNDVVPSASAIEFVFDSIVVVSNEKSPTYNFFDLNGKKLYSINELQLNTYYGGTFINYKDIVYDINGNQCFIPQADWTIKEFDYKTNGLVYYTLVKEIKEGETINYINETYVYDTISEKTTLIDNTGNIEFERGFYFIANTENKTMSLYSVFDGTVIFKDQQFADFSTYDCGDYTLIIGEKEDGTTTVYQCNNI